MMIPASVKVAIIAAMVAAACGTGWIVRGWRCDLALAEYQAQQNKAAQDQRTASLAVEAKQEAATGQSTERLDQQQAEQQKETVYVEKQVIQYRDRWRDRTCQRPAEWVSLYNKSLFGSGTAMPKTSAARSAPSGAGM